MKILDVLKVLPPKQSTIVDVYVDGDLKYCSSMEFAETAEDILTKMSAPILDMTVTEIATKEWKDVFSKDKKVSLFIVSDN